MRKQASAKALLGNAALGGALGAVSGAVTGNKNESIGRRALKGAIGGAVVGGGLGAAGGTALEAGIGGAVGGAVPGAFSGSETKRASAYGLYMEMMKPASATRRGLALLESMRAAHGELPLFHNTEFANVPSVLEHGLLPTVALARAGGKPTTIEAGRVFGRYDPHEYTPEFVDRMHSLKKMEAHMFSKDGDLPNYPEDLRPRIQRAHRDALTGASDETPGSVLRRAAYPDEYHKNLHSISFKTGFPASDYGDVSFILSKPDIHGRLATLDDLKARLGDEQQAWPVLADDGDTIIFPSAHPRVIGYEPSPDKAQWVREMKAQGYQLVPMSKKLRQANDKNIGAPQQERWYRDPQSSDGWWREKKHRPGWVREDRWDAFQARQNKRTQAPPLPQPELSQPELSQPEAPSQAPPSSQQQQQQQQQQQPAAKGLPAKQLNLGAAALGALGLGGAAYYASRPTNQDRQQRRVG